VVELGINAGAGIETGPRTRCADAPQRAVTEHILALADRAGYSAALIDAVAQSSGESSVITWPQFAQMVRAAARGLSRRGLREADTAAIFVQDAVSHVVAVHSVRAAGAIAAPVRPARTAADIAAQLKQGRARLLITCAALAELAIQAAERSWVRQVFAFGEAEGTTPFGSLLQTARHGQLQANGSADPGGDEAVVLDLTGLNGLALYGHASRLTRRDVVVAAPPCGDPDAYTALLDLALAAGATIVAAPLPQVAAAVGVYKGTAAIVPQGTDIPGLLAERVFTVG
jgi:acyl-CoA synthetase (AMP-forming)/AMP-acid ligase II